MKKTGLTSGNRQTIMFGLMIMLVTILSISLVSAWDMTIDNKKEYNESTETIAIWDIGEISADTKLVEAKLITPKVNRVIHGTNVKVWEQDLETYITDYNTFEKTITDMRFYNVNDGMKEVEKQITWKVKQISYVNTTDYHQDCVDSGELEKNGSIKYDCQLVPRNYMKEVVEWIPLEKAEKLDKRITLGAFTQVEKGETIEWGYKLAGFNVLENWATWTESFTAGLRGYFNMSSVDESSANKTKIQVRNGAIKISGDGKINGNYNPYIDNNGYIVTTNLTSCANASLNFWFKTYTDTTTAQKILSENNGSIEGDILIGDFAGNDKFGTNNFWSKNNHNVILGSVVANTYYMVTFVYDKNDTLFEYVDGVLVNSTKNGQCPQKGTNNLNLGVRNTGANDMVNGSIDELGFWNRTLSPDEVTGLYNGGSGITYTTEIPSTPAPSFYVNVSLLNPANETNSTSSTYNFNATLKGINSNITNATLYIWDGDTISYLNANTSIEADINATINVTFTNSSFADGNYKWGIIVCGFNETDGNCTWNAEGNRTFIIDTTKPIINFTAPVSSEGNQTWNSIWQNVTSNETHPDTITLYIGNDTWNNASASARGDTAFYLNYTGLKDGTYWFNATQNDTFGNWNKTETRTIMIDTSAPVINFSSPTMSSRYSDAESVCYQEQPNSTDATPTGCANSQLGVFGGDMASEGFDGDWDTATSTSSQTLYANYTKPDYATNNSRWKIKYESGGADGNFFTLTSACWDAYSEKVVLKFSKQTGTTCNWYCHDGADFVQINGQGGCDELYEEGMNWTIYPREAYAQSSIWANITASDDTLKNITIELFDVEGFLVDATTTSSPNYYNFTSLADGLYWMNATACDTSEACSSTGTRRYLLDTTLPIVTILAPLNASELYFFNVANANVTFNASASDSYLSSCWYYNGTANNTITCNENTTLLLDEGWNTLGYYANDTAGNRAENLTSFFIYLYNYSLKATETALEGENVTISFNVTATNISSIMANFSINNRVYNSTLVSNNGTFAQFYDIIPAPRTLVDTNFSIEVNYTLNNIGFTALTSVFVYTTQAFTFGNCNTPTMNFTVLDERNLTKIGAVLKYNFRYGVSNSSATQTYGTWDATNGTFFLCVNTSLSPTFTIGYGEIEYSSEGYLTRNYYIFNGTIITTNSTNVTLINLENGYSTAFLFTFANTNLVPYVNHYLKLLRWYPQTNDYKTVEMAKTDDKGQSIMRVKSDDTDYRVGIYEQDGTLVKLLNPVRFACRESPCTYTSYIETTTGDWTSRYNVISTLTFNNETNIWNYIYEDTSGNTDEMRLAVTKQSGDTSILICNTSTTGAIGALSCNSTGYSGMLVGIAYRTASPEYPINQEIAQVGSTVFRSSIGLFITLILFITLTLIGIVSPVISIVLGIISLVPALILGSITVPIFIGIAVIGGIVVHFLKRTG